MAEQTLAEIKQSAEQKMGKSLEALKNDLSNKSSQRIGVIAKRIWAHQRFSRQFQQNAAGLSHSD